MGGAAASAIAGFAATVFAGFIAATVGLPFILVVAAGFALGALAKAIIDNWDQIVSNVSNFFAPIGEYFKGSFDLVIGVLTGDRERILKGVRQIGESIMDMFNNIRDTWATLTGGQTSGQATADVTAARVEARFQAAAASQRVGARFAGNLPQFLPTIKSASGGLFEALATEIRNMPSGASPVIANDSELIVPRNQIGAMVGAIQQNQSPVKAMVGATQQSPAVLNLGGGGQGGKSIVINYAPTLNFNGDGDTESQAKELLRMFDIFFQEYVEGQLA
ncbi:MAG: hypothetical protein HC781_06345 [Leptolyngbyaceae cyanobacterium CSU_1_4]|nr:hypothetical protein [Leptolyngbyaceae cyanobacterium CSU_1_4]